jgi:dephospho-CoA kinase
MPKKQVVVMIVGLPGSGKSLSAQMLKNHGFEVIELGDIWRELLKKNGISRYDPINTREFTRKLRVKYGKDVYARHAYKKIQGKRSLVAIMGVRSTYERDYFRKKIKKFYTIALLAPVALRFGRLKHRHKPEDPETLKAFKWLDTRERRGFMKARSEEKHGVMHIIKDADFVIANTSTIAKLELNLNKIIGKIKEMNA